MVCCGISTLLANSEILILPIKSFKFCANATKYLFSIVVFYTNWCKILDITPIGVIEYKYNKNFWRFLTNGKAKFK